LTDLYSINQKIISSRNAKIEKSEDKIERLQKKLNKYYSVSFDKLTAEARTNYNGLKTDQVIF
jgi:F0F1-type ATP synthase membrane subunit b/b'